MRLENEPESKDYYDSNLKAIIASIRHWKRIAKEIVLTYPNLDFKLLLHHTKGRYCALCNHYQFFHKQEKWKVDVCRPCGFQCLVKGSPYRTFRKACHNKNHKLAAHHIFRCIDLLLTLKQREEART